VLIIKVSSFAATLEKETHPNICTHSHRCTVNFQFALFRGGEKVGVFSYIVCIR
jgi:hypothetical protein